MTDRPMAGRHRLPGSGLLVVPALIAAGVFLAAQSAGRPQAGILLGLAAWLIAGRLVVAEISRRTVRAVEALLAHGDAEGASALLAHGHARLRGNRHFMTAYESLSKSAVPGPEPEPERTGWTRPLAFADRPSAPHASWPAILLLCVAPLSFAVPWLHSPFLSLLPSVLVASLSVWLLSHRLAEWDGKVALGGLALAAASWVFWALALFARRLPGLGALAAPGPGVPNAPRMALVLQLLVLGISVILHECAHGVAAFLSGDPTAKRAGRISLNPIRHVDPVGTIILPILLALIPGGVVFGWAKPVPVNPGNFRHARRGRLAVSLAGVATNLFLALFCASLLMGLGVLLHLYYPTIASAGFILAGNDVILAGIPRAALWQLCAATLQAGVLINMILFSLNILPIPPLDGFGVLESVVPARIQSWLQRARTIGFLLVFALIALDLIKYLLIPGLHVALILIRDAGLIARLW